MKSLLVELFVEELPPKALKALGEAFGAMLLQGLRAQGLAGAHSALNGFASPRRLAAHVSHVLAVAPDKPVSVKLMPVSVGLDAAGAPTPALLKKLAGLGADAAAVPTLARQGEGKAETLLFESVVRGATLAEGLQKALDDAIAKLPVPKLMSYQLETGSGPDFQPGWTSVNFVRPAHGLVALHGADVVPVSALGLTAGRATRGHRFEAAMDPVMLLDADHYAHQLAEQGAVIASFGERRAEIARQLGHAAAREGLTPIRDDALLDEVTALVERPNVLLGRFEAEFLAVPQECLILTMKANQKYFPLLDAAGRLTEKFLLVSNIRPADPSRVIEGNERVVRPRLADAKFFYDQDRKKKIDDWAARLDRVVYHAKLGNMGQRTERVRAIAARIAEQLGGSELVALASRAASIAKADLLSDMVGEFPELQGIMGSYYALHGGDTEAVAFAVEDHYKPRFAGDALPRGEVGLVVALADKLETLAGLFGIGQRPSGDKDPFALRRHALGVIRILVERGLALDVTRLIAIAFHAFPEGHGQAQAEVALFLDERLVGYLRERGYSAHEVDAVVALRPERWAELPQRLAAVRAFAALPEAPALAAANKRVGNILKKSNEAVPSGVNPGYLCEPAEIALYQMLEDLGPRSASAFARNDYAGSLQMLAALKEPVDRFFDEVMVNVEDDALRVNRHTLLQRLQYSMNRVADLSRLAG